MREPDPTPKPAPFRQWAMAAAGVIMIALAVAMVLRQRAPSPPPPRNVRAAGQPPIVLYVQHDGPALRLHWNPDAPAIRAASAGALSIADGARQSRLDLKPRDLSAGVASYWPESREVTFQLELDGAPAGTIRASADQPGENRPSPFTSDPKHAISRASKRVQSEDSGEDNPPPPSIVRYDNKTPVAAPPPPAHAPQEIKEPPPPPARAIARESKEPAAIPTHESEDPPPPKSSASNSRLHRFVGKIPLLRRLRKH